MYTTYFGFQEEPFSLTPTSRLFYSNPVYEAAYAQLMQGIRERKGFLVLTGEVGTGKTTLVRRIIDHLQDDASVRISFSYYSTLTFEELISFACRDLGVTRKNVGELQDFGEYLKVRSKSGGTTALVIDEAQDIEEDVLEHLFRLSDSPHVSGQLLQVILVGQHPELDKKLSHPRFDSLRHKVHFRCQLEHLKPEEVRAFIYHRLRLVGYKGNDLFNPEVIQLITSYSAGIPRLVNLICDNALRTAREASRRVVTLEDIQEVITTLRLRGRRLGEASEELAEEAEPAPSDPAGFVAQRPAPPAAGRWQSLAWGGAGFLFVLLGFLLFTMTRTTQSLLPAQTVAEADKPAPVPASSDPATAVSATPVLAPSSSLNVNDSRVRRGQAVIADLKARYHSLHPIAWGLATSTPAIALVIPEGEWRQLSKDDQVNLTLYLESLIPAVRTNPDPYVEEFRATAVYEAFRGKLTALCPDCWILGTGHVSGEGKKAVFDKVVVQGNSLWENAPSEGRGMSALSFRAMAKTEP
jgi:general secretion pathway protein A